MLPLLPLRASVNCDLGEGFSLYSIANDEALMRTIHTANIACGFHAGDFSIIKKTVALAKANNVHVGAHPSLPDLQGFGRREMAMEPDELASCFIYQVGALSGFLRMYDIPLHHIKPHGAIYGQTSRNLSLARAVVDVVKIFDKGQRQRIAFVGLAGTAHQIAAEEAGVNFVAEWFADLDYDEHGKLLITKCLNCAAPVTAVVDSTYFITRSHKLVPLDEVRTRVQRLLSQHLVTTSAGTFIPIGDGVVEVTICCHSDTPNAVEVAQLVKSIVDESNSRAGYN